MSFGKEAFKRQPGIGQKLKEEKGMNNEEYLEYVISMIPVIPGSEDQELYGNNLIDCFRFLRNRLGSPDASTLSWTPLLENAYRIVYYIDYFIANVDIEQNETTYKSETIDNNEVTDKSEPQTKLAVMRVAIQFLGNAVTSKETAEVFREQIRLHSKYVELFVKLLEHFDEKMRQYGSMLIYNCLWNSEIRQRVASSAQIVVILVDIYEEGGPGTEWITLIFEKLFEEEETFLETVWPFISEKYRSAILDVAADLVVCSSDANPNGGDCDGGIGDNASPRMVHEKNASFLASVFVAQCSQSMFDWPIEMNELKVISATLDFLCSVTSLENRYQSIIDDEEVLEATLAMLQVFDLGKDQKEELAKLASRIQLNGDVNGFKSPLMNFRSRLVRLLANLCYKHQKNQKLMRENGGIQLILNCTPLDADNPYITQWCLFALRNLTDGCPENQRFIASLEFQGFASEVDRKQYEQLLKPKNKETVVKEDGDAIE